MDKGTQTMIDNLQKNTGKSLEQWTGIVKKSNITKHSDIIKMLKEDHELTYGFANLIAHKSKGSDAGSAENSDELVINQYKGKEDLKPLYDTLIENIKSFGSDIEISPKNAYVSLRRKKQFGLIQPSTKARIDIGLNFKSKEPSGKLEAAGSFNAMCTHRIRIEKREDIDKNVIAWIKEAYEGAG